jgi:thiamine-monophosphate kinase
MSELSLIRRFRRSAPTHPYVLVGPGQDCAILKWPAGRELAFKIDQIVEGTHFVLKGPEAATPRQVGWKAMAKACSDIAAAGCWPIAATVAVNLPRGYGDSLALELNAGLAACCKRYGFALAGGDISASKHGLSIVVSLLGEGPTGKREHAWTRSGAKPGDVLFVTGTLGGSRGGKHLNFMPRLEEAREIRRIIPSGVHACIDITDGLSRDLFHLCEESRRGAAIVEAAIPITAGRKLTHALRDGEDFELLLAVAPDMARKLRRQWKLKTRLTPIGRVLSRRFGCRILRSNGSVEAMPNVGYEHRT